MRHRPRVLLNMATALDGKINPAPALRAGAFMMSRRQEDPRRMQDLRATADAILIGATNLRRDDPDLSLLAAERERRAAAGRREPWRVVVTTRGDGITPRLKLFDRSLGGPAVVAHASVMSAEARTALSSAATLVSLGEKAVDIARLLAYLGDDLGACTVMCEGGGDIAAQLFTARAVDSLYLTVVPRILGGVSSPTVVDGPGFRADEIPDPTLAECERVGDELFLRYDFRWS